MRSIRPRSIRSAVVRPFAALAALFLVGAAHAEDKVIAITYFVDHPAIAESLRGVKEGLKRGGIEDGKGYRFEVQSAQGSPIVAVQIAQKFAGMNPVAIVALSTSSAQPTLANVRDIPVVFTGVTDPVATKLVADLQHPGKNATGTKEAPPIAALVDLVQKLTPSVKRIGILYNAGEAGSKAQAEEASKLFQAKGIKVESTTVTKPADVPSAVASLVGSIDAIYAPNDSTLLAGFESLTRVQNEQKLPIYVTALGTLDKGAFAGLGASFFDGGVTAGSMVVDIVKNGKKPGDIPVGLPTRVETGVNTKTAKTIGIAIDPAFLAGPNVIAVDK